MKEFVIGAAGIVLAGAAVAQVAPPAAPQAAPMAERVQTRDEMVGKVREHFVQLDANRDGSLTREEAEAGRKVFKERIRARLGERRQDRLRDRDPAQAFNRLDTNKDGSISQDEFAKGREVRKERRERRIAVNQAPGTPGAAHAPGMPHRGMRMHRMGGMMGGHMFDMADANKDGRVTLQEATDSAARHFDMADANRDGRVTREERRQMHRQMIEKRRAPKAG